MSHGWQHNPDDGMDAEFVTDRPASANPLAFLIMFETPKAMHVMLHVKFFLLSRLAAQ